jgi:hypothetical protein
MSFRHAAALALVGWYLIVPPSPYGSDGDTRPLSQIPLSEWRTQHVFDSAQDCDELLSRWRAIAAKAEKEDREFRAVAQRNPKTGLFEAPPGFKTDPAFDKMTLDQLYAYEGAECIATDDPRLKEKQK